MSIAYGILLCETSEPQIFDGFVELSIDVWWQPDV